MEGRTGQSTPAITAPVPAPVPPPSTRRPRVREVSSRFMSPVASSSSSGDLHLPTSNSPRHNQRSISTQKSQGDIKRQKKVLGQQADAHSLKLLRNRYLQWRFANANADVRKQAHKAEAERMFYSLGLKMSELSHCVRKKRIELQGLMRVKAIKEIVEPQMPLLEQWTTLEEEYSTSLSETSGALLNASLRLPLDADIKVYIVRINIVPFCVSFALITFDSQYQVETKELGEVLAVASKSMEGIVQNIVQFLPKTQEIESLLPELARVSSREKVAVEDCGVAVLKTHSSHSDAYQGTGCYNLLCSGFVQINREIAMGGSISPLSGYGNSQYDITILIWKMGSGRFAEEGWGKASYFKNTISNQSPHLKMGNCLSITDPSPEAVSEKILKALPVETPFKFPSPLPTLPQGNGFAKRTIDLGGLEVSQVSTFNKVWSTYEGGPDNLGATFFEPSSVPSGFSILGYYAQPNNHQLFGWVLTARDLSSNTLKSPLDYTLVANTESLKIKQDGPGYIWLPVPPDGYQAVGLLVTTTSQKPPLDKLRCVRSDLTEQCEADTWIWGTNGVNVSNLRPNIRGTQATGVCVGTFTWQPQNSSPPSLSCLKNTKLNFSTMPNGSQIGVLFNTYSPLIYLHPDEEYLPSSVNWYFSNGALLYKQGQESNPNPIESNGTNLPQGGSNDGSYWLDLPIDKKAKERVKKGDLQNTKAYLHIKPMLGATFTDIAIWLFYPFNGPARAKVKFINLPLGRIGEHIGDWEHVTLRISNFTGELWRVFLSQHSGGVWLDACDLEFQGGGSNKPVAYASLHGHAMYAKPGLVLQGDDDVGIRNDTAKSKKVVDTGLGYEVVAAEYEGGGVVEPPWLNYYRKWGPKIDYSVDDDVKRVARLLPGALKKAFVNFAKKIPDEVYGEDGPTGPKLKGNWAGDEK
ncbi:unnamed protein product [Brassica oleracea]